MSRLLKDKVFISTRPEGQSDELALLFSNAGATLLEMPLIKILPSPLTVEERNCFKLLKDFHWLIFTSPNGVRCFFEKLEEIQGDQHLPVSLQLAVIGKKTGQVLNRFGYKASFINPGSSGKDFAGAFIQKIKSDNYKPTVLLALGNLARTVIQDQINEIALCTRLNLYETIAPESPDEKMMQLILDDNYEMLLFTSSSGIQNFLKLAGKIQPEKIRAACIGATTSETAVENNILPKVVAQNSASAGLFESVLNYYKK